MSGMWDGVSKVWVTHVGGGLNINGFESDYAAARQLLKSHAISNGAFKGNMECLIAFKAEIDSLIAEFELDAKQEACEQDYERKEYGRRVCKHCDLHYEGDRYDDDED